MKWELLALQFGISSPNLLYTHPLRYSLSVTLVKPSLDAPNRIIPLLFAVPYTHLRKLFVFLQHCYVL